MRRAHALKAKKHYIRVGRDFSELTILRNAEGKIIHRTFRPLMLHFSIKDLLQVIIGATLLAIPVGFTEESWRLGEALPLWSVLVLGCMSLAFIGLFTYHHYYQEHVEEHFQDWIKRTLITYVVSVIVVGLLLTTIQKAPWFAETLIALKRTLVVALPASLSAAVVDVLK